MNKLFTKKKNRILFYFLIFFLSFLFDIFIQLSFYGNKLDFFWNYNFGLQISKGVLPYTGFNIVLTPLLSFLTGGVLKVFGSSIVVYVIFMSFLKVSLVFLFSKISSILIESRKELDKFKIFLLSFLLMHILIYNFYFEYNYFAIFFLLFIIYLEIILYRKKKDDYRFHFIIGICSSLSFLSKQSIGLIVIFFVLLKVLLFDKDNKVKKILFRLLGVFLPILIFLIYLILTNSLSSFIDYCILGLKDFKGNYVSYFHFLDELFTINRYRGIYSYILYWRAYLFLFAVIYIYYKFYKQLKSKNKLYPYAYILVLFYSLPAFACFYPISDLTHLLPSIIPISILIFNSLYDKLVLLNKSIKYMKIKRIFLAWGMCLLIVFYFNPFIFYFNSLFGKNKDSVVLDNKYGNISYVVISKNSLNIIDNVISFEKEMKEKGIKVIILFQDAVMYHLPQDIYYKDYDLFMRGNFGKNGEERLINEIKNSKNTIYLVLKDELFSTGQIPKKVINYVKTNLKRDGEILIYDIYK